MMRTSTLTLVAAVALAGLSSAASANMLNNPGFESDLGFDFADITNWNGFFGGPPGTQLAAFNDQLPATEVFEGDKALLLRIAGNNNPAAGDVTPGFDAFAGHVQDVSGIVGGELYAFSIWAREFVNDGNVFEFRIEWINAVGGEISRNNIELQDQLTGDWAKYTNETVAPDDAVNAKVVLAVQSFTNDGNFANIQVGVDAASFAIVPEPASAGLLALGGAALIRRR
ncbi:PEP-CTERM sorting domain-containing protein [Mucisphaera calidilacus]|uniref:PEP-CTERM protein-sorting domain-containing protein n=1 Tax=Mucisphaera calidilacus TaxID=2527982 RepID=A0A518BY20_9BACT|nr:PEP-CTERM sorting domain-containing protein [Mucisphaera calidilacus]QDU71875.1 hypothetical protein Pan265_17330 [Mucisphaera calidilacus]